ncbi:hypothetical protein OROMI_016934 [Orobanche minor]
MAAFCRYHQFPAVYNACYDDIFTSYYFHHQNPLAPVRWVDKKIPIFVFVHEKYLMYSHHWFPVYVQYQTQPYVGYSYTHNVIHVASVSGGAVSNDHYQQFMMDCDDSWVMNAREEEEDDDILLNEEELRAWNSLDEDLVVYDSSDVDDDGLSQQTITQHLKTRNYHPVGNAQICVVCQDCLLQEDEKIATLDCGHGFHVGCITSWMMLKNSCPLCRGMGIRGL